MFIRLPKQTSANVALSQALHCMIRPRPDSKLPDALSLEPTTAPLAFFHSELLDIDTSHDDTDMLGTELAKLELLDLAGASDTQVFPVTFTKRALWKQSRNISAADLD